MSASTEAKEGLRDLPAPNLFPDIPEVPEPPEALDAPEVPAVPVMVLPFCFPRNFPSLRSAGFCPAEAGRALCFAGACPETLFFRPSSSARVIFRFRLYSLLRLLSLLFLLSVITIPREGTYDSPSRTPAAICPDAAGGTAVRPHHMKRRAASHDAAHLGFREWV